jgi:enamine deaminase RidA (YjgF/YER057c/UK114 family)
LPDVPVPVVAGYDAAFVPFVRTGNLVYLSGRLEKKDAKPWSGKMGEQITTLEGKQAARGIAIELLATLQSALGDLDKIKRIVRLLVMVNSTPNFTEPHVLPTARPNFSWKSLASVERMRAARLARRRFHSGGCVEIDLIAEVIDRADAPKGT